MAISKNTAPAPRRILMVCLGNICRSPMAQGAMEAALAQAGLDMIEVDSAGTGNWHTGEPPDRRAIAAARRAGIDISRQRARQVTAADFSRFDLVLAMDHANFAELRRRAPVVADAHIALMMDLALGRDEAVPDPYYDGEDAFDRVFQMVSEAANALAGRWSGASGDNG